MPAKNERPSIVVAVNESQVTAVGRPDRLRFLSRAIGDSPGQHCRQVRFPDVETAGPTRRGENDTLAARVPVRLLIEMPAVTDFYRIVAVVGINDPDLALPRALGLVQHLSAVGRPARAFGR